MPPSHPSKLKRKRKTTEPYNPLDEGEDQREVTSFASRSILPTKFGNILSFNSGGFLFQNLIEEQGLDQMFEDTVEYYPDLVKVFYCNLKVEKNVLYSQVKGKKIRMDVATFGNCARIPSVGLELGDGLPCPWSDFDKKAYYTSLCRESKLASLLKKRELCETHKTKDTMLVGILNPDDRLLHYFMTYVFLPKGTNHAQINELELQLMYAMKNHNKVNWAFVIMNHMAKAKAGSTAFPYARLLTHVFQARGVPLDGEPSSIGRDDDRIDKNYLGHLKIVLDEDSRSYKFTDDDEVDATSIPRAPAAASRTPSLDSSPFQVVLDRLDAFQLHVNDSLDSFRSYVGDQFVATNAHLVDLNDRVDVLSASVRGLHEGIN